MTMTNCNTIAQPRSHRRISIFPLLKQAVAARHQRRVLAKLDKDMLDDLGLTYSQAQAEAKRPIWDVPAYWRC